MYYKRPSSKNAKNRENKRVPGIYPNGAMAALETIRSQYSEHRDEIFKTVTTDSSSEFSMLSEIEDLRKTLLCFTHAYTSCEKRSVKRHNCLVLESIPVPPDGHYTFNVQLVIVICDLFIE